MTGHLPAHVPPRRAAGSRSTPLARPTTPCRPRTQSPGAEPDFVALWLDQGYLQGLPPAEVTGSANDPKRYVLNVMFTCDLPRHGAQIRAVWGGALCLSRVQRSEVELEQISAEVDAPLMKQIVGGSHGGKENNVTRLVFVAFAAEQRRLDAKYDTGTVRLMGWFEPID